MYKIGTLFILQPYYKFINNSIGTTVGIICFETFINRFLLKVIEHDRNSWIMRDVEIFLKICVRI